MCVCVRVCVRARTRARVCARVRACVSVWVWVRALARALLKKNRGGKTLKKVKESLQCDKDLSNHLSFMGKRISVQLFHLGKLKHSLDWHSKKKNLVWP